DGASGRQVTAELADSRPEALASASRSNLVPNRVPGKEIFWRLDKLSILYVGPDTLVGRALKRRNPVPCGDLNDRALANMGVALLPRVVGCKGRSVLLQSGARRDVGCVIWALG